MLHQAKSIGTSDAIVNADDTGFLRAVGTAIERALGFDTMADDAALAVRARRRERMNRALETIENVRFSSVNHFKGLVVIVAADLARAMASSSWRLITTGGSNLCALSLLHPEGHPQAGGFPIELQPSAPLGSRRRDGCDRELFDGLGQRVDRGIEPRES